MTQQVKTLCSYLLNSHQLCKKILNLKAFFIQKAIIFTKKLKTCAALCIAIGKPNLFRQDFWAKPYFESKQLLVLFSKRHFGRKILEVCI